MSLKFYRELIQGTDEWFAVRRGILTASVVGKLLTPTLKVANNDTTRGVTLTLAGERITGNIDPSYLSVDMWRGVEDEPIARDLYAEHHAPVEELGFMVRDLDCGFKLGCSPDGLVGDVGLIECKSRLQKVQLQTIIEDRVPAENMAQLQCGLLVSARDWCDYVSFCGGMPLYVKRVYPDPIWHAAILAAVETFEANVADILARYHEVVAGLPATERVNRDAEIEF